MWFPILILLLFAPPAGHAAFHQAATQTGLVSVPGTKVKLAPPPGFAPAKQFPGFINEDTGSSIVVTEMPAPFSQITAGFDSKSLAAGGMTLLSRREISIGGAKGVLLHVSQVAQSIDFLKWIVAVGNEKETVLIAATFPKELKADLSAVMEKSVLSSRWDHDAQVDQLAGLNFSIKDDPAMKFAKRVSGLMLMTKDGSLPGKPNNDPIFIVGSAVSQVNVEDKKKFAEQRILQTEGLSGAAIKKANEVTIDGLPGYVIIAEARQTNPPEQPMVVYQTLLFDGDSYFIMQGFTPPEEQKKYLEIFERIAQSFRRK